MERTLDIAEVARETGVGKDSLRAWERRYGFPSPQRNAVGERAYTQAEVDRLRAIQRLLLSGLRPGKVVGLPQDALDALLAREPADTPAGGPATEATGEGAEAALQALQAQDIAGLRRLLSQALARLGLAAFVTQVAAPLSRQIGQAWMEGRLRIHEEHLGSEVLHGVLRAALHSLPEPPADATPRVLLTTLPGEPHTLGLLMAEAMLALEGCHCISLGAQTPSAEIAAAAARYRADVVALSAAGGLPPRRLAQAVAQLRGLLPSAQPLWLGGHGAVAVSRGHRAVEVFSDLQSIAPVVRAWRTVIGMSPNSA